MVNRWQEPVDITPFCCGSLGITLLVGYIVFAFSVTRHGDFYQVRRWKASILAAVISSILFIIGYFAAFAVPILGALFTNPDLLFNMKIDKQFLTGYLELILFGLVILMPFMFIGTLGTYYRLKQWLTSDDFLDTIWKDPNKNKKSPIQWL